MALSLIPHRLIAGLPSAWACLACSEWGVEDRCALLRLLCSLCAESTRLHNKLMGEEDEVGGWLAGWLAGAVGLLGVQR